MRKDASALYSLFLVVGDFLALVLAFVGAYILRVKLDLGFHSAVIAHPVSATTYFGIFLLLMPFWLIIFALLGLYSSSIYEKRFAEAGRLLIGSFVGLLFVASYAYASNQQVFPAKLVPIYGFVLAFLLLLLFRTVARIIRGILFAFNIGLTNLMIVGNNGSTTELINSLWDSRRSGYRIVGIVASGKYIPAEPNLKKFATFAEASERVKADDIDHIIQTELYANPDRNNEILNFAQQHHIVYRFVPGNTELFVGKLEVELFRSAMPVIAVHQTALIGWGRIAKRLFDLVVASILLVIFLPVMALVALLVKLSDGGPVFLRQIRLTRFDQEFLVFKFRTNNTTYNGLTPDQAFTKMGRPDLLKIFRDNGNFLPNDPRNTRIGKFLRSTSLDELPQLFNVIQGDLSLVGPRALIPKDLEQYRKRHTILSVKSGITGLAQVSGRNYVPVDERRKLDTYYVQNWSFWLDIVILLKTIRVALSGDRSL